MEWSIQDVAKLAGTTSRALRHYGDLGLLEPSRTGANGYRYYDGPSLVRLQRILLLRELGLGLPAIAEVLADRVDDAAALRSHRQWLASEQERLDRQITSVELTIRKLEGGEQLMAEEILDGFEHTQYKDEVESRWGTAAWANSDAWWRSKTPDEKKDWQQRQKQLAADWMAAAKSGVSPESAEAGALAQRHFEWLRAIPGTPGGGASGPPKAYFEGLAEMYVADPRFAANYGGIDGAQFVRDAMIAFAQAHL
jgi:DNA-binding transcriptional MerR regulator